MARILITGSSTGLGHSAAEALLDHGHQVTVHARNEERLAAVGDLIDRGASNVTGDLGDLGETVQLAEQATALGAFDAVIHNAGVIDGSGLLPVNVVAPYVLTALVPAGRLIYLSSSMHRGGSPDLTGIDWTGARPNSSYSDSKLFVTTLAAAVARLRPETVVHTVDPGWVPTRMGGSQASDDLREGHRTQVWLATTDDPAALVSGGYWHHHRRQEPHPAAGDDAFQDALLASLTEHTRIALPLS
ncbi:SDR family NAD(P)-dependent oxidoreductase [Nesterenkonia sp. CL21]|uniref:SDR family NAD(P)-dependent oxidoreductase n=1 Tax=Nesterenkonia sp. CL21 TaxID=3064894 RepID=UPI00287A2D7A|nr:SDR family NAD(P)-dependent oxidoreductase [Nesterenkonia sp. CL21]MDS2171470.1 SDR family NAD(P)-dependent oxidoreductase [Nesterenkonia sp. CL21]